MRPLKIHFQCECGKQFKVDSTHSGRKSRCPDCGVLFVVPLDTAEGSYMPVAPVVERPAGSLPVERTHREDSPSHLDVFQPFAPEEHSPQESDSASGEKPGTPSSLEAPPTDALSPVRTSVKRSAGKDLPPIGVTGDAESSVSTDVPDDELGKVWTDDPINPFAERRKARETDEREPGRLETGYWTAFRYPLRSRSRTMLVAGTLLFANATAFWLLVVTPLFSPSRSPDFLLLFSLLAVLPVFWILGFFANFCLRIVGHTIAEQDDAPGRPDFLDLWETVTKPTLRLIATALLSFSPLFVCLVLHAGLDGSGARLILCALEIVFLVMGALYLPMAILATCFYRSMAAINPYLVIGTARKAGLDYACVSIMLAAVTFPGSALVGYLTVLMWAALFAGHWLLAMTAALPIFALGLYLAMVASRMLGLFYRRNREQLGWDQTLEAQQPDAGARGGPA